MVIVAGPQLFQVCRWWRTPDMRAELGGLLGGVTEDAVAGREPVAAGSVGDGVVSSTRIAGADVTVGGMAVGLRVAVAWPLMATAAVGEAMSSGISSRASALSASSGGISVGNTPPIGVGRRNTLMKGS